VSNATGCGDASACLKLRTPLIRRDRGRCHQVAYRVRPRDFTE